MDQWSFAPREDCYHLRQAPNGGWAWQVFDAEGRTVRAGWTATKGGAESQAQVAVEGRARPN